jgi:hypothetical protein
MNNPDEKQGQKQGQDLPTDKGKDAEDRRDTAQRAWNDRAGIPRGTPEQGGDGGEGGEGGKKADRVGGTGTESPEPEFEDDDVERQGGRKAEKFDDDEKKV